MRVAILTPAAELGGAERSLLTFLQVAHGHALKATVILPRMGPLAECLSELGIPWEVVSMPRALLCQSRRYSGNLAVVSLMLSWQGPVYLSRLTRSIGKIGPTVLYTYGIKGNLIGALLRPLLRARLVWHLRDVCTSTLLSRLADFGPHLIIANSQASAWALQQRMRRPEKVTVVHNAVDTEEFSQEGSLAVGETQSDSIYLIGLAGPFAWLKGHALLLQAAELILQEFPQARFYFIGGSIYDTAGDRGFEDELRQKVALMGLQDHVVFTGFQRHMAPWYRAMDVVVSTSLVPESFGRTLLEAMACGRAVVGPDAGGIPEFVRHGQNGLLYEKGNPRELAEAILTLLRHPALRYQLGVAGRKTAVESFAPVPQARTIMSLLATDADLS